MNRRIIIRWIAVEPQYSGNRFEEVNYATVIPLPNCVSLYAKEITCEVVNMQEDKKSGNESPI